MKISWSLKKRFSFWTNLTSGQKTSFIFLFLFLVAVPLSFIAAIKPVKLRQKAQTATPQTISQPVRGQPYDFWADIEVGRRDFTEIVPNEVVPNKLFKPEGIFVDRSASPIRAYVWDSGNSRLLGLDLAKCYAQKASNPNSPCTADLVFGQPSGNDYGACNQDSSFQTYPNRPDSSASTLCGVSERTHTVMEDGTAIHMDADLEGNLFVPDFLNNRVLKFNQPWETDTVADEVWGQADFRGNLCNRNGNTYGPWRGGPPTNLTLCGCSAAGCALAVTLDQAGNLWVADGGNNRVLRFSKNSSTGIISKAADLVLGRPDFTTGGDTSGGNGLNQMKSPSALSFNKEGKLYVADSGNSRILVFAPPFQSGMSASGTFGPGFSGEGVNGPISVKVDTDPNNPNNQVVWTSENDGWNATIKIWNTDGSLRKVLPIYHQPTAGQFDIDATGNLLYADYVTNDIYYLRPKNDNYELAFTLFPPYGENQISGRRFGASAWVGVAVAANQLIVGESRLLFWNNPLSLANGQSPDGYVGTSSPTEYPQDIFGFYQLKADAQNRIWVSRQSEIWVYQAPLIIGAQPIKIIKGPIPVLGGGQIILGESNSNIFGLVPTSNGKFLWLSQADKNRVLRIRNPLFDPLIDIILGQTSLSGYQCNRGEIPEHGPNPNLNMLCYPGNLSLDKKGNLYVSDHTIEVRGNNRVLLFSPNLFSDNPSSVIFAPDAVKEFRSSSSWSGEMFETAFDSTNRMVAGYNPYSGKRFLGFYNNPLKLNSSSSPKDDSYAVPDGELKDFYGWPIAAAFDNEDNLFVYDANRGKVMIYKQPFIFKPTPTPTPKTFPSPTSYLITSTPSPTPLGPITKKLVSSQDTFINVWPPNQNYGNGTTFKVGLSGTSNYTKGLLSFNFTSIPKNAIISSAVLTLNTSGWGGSSGNVDVYRILKKWGENQVTWKKASTTINWELAGCQGKTDIEAKKYTSFTGSFGKVAVNLTDLVKLWITNPSSNNGLLMKATTPNTAFFFDSKENSDVTKRPKLTVTYTLP